METSRDTREKILIQTELEEAGFDLQPLKKMLLPQTSASIKDRNDLLQVRKNVFLVPEFHALDTKLVSTHKQSLSTTSIMDHQSLRQKFVKNHSNQNK